MKKKQLLNEFSTVDLLESLDNNNNNISDSPELQENQTVVHDNMLEFISHYKIKKGSEPVKRRVLYKIFKNWTNSQDYGSRYFSLQLDQYFYSDKEHIFIDIDALDLTKKAKDVFFRNDKSRGVSVKFKEKYIKIQVEEFTKLYRIVDGEYQIDGNALYYIYENWAITTKRKVMKQIDFIAVLKYFMKNERNYKLNTTLFYIDKQQLKGIGVTTLEKAKAWAEENSKQTKKKSRAKKETFIVKARKN